MYPLTSFWSEKSSLSPSLAYYFLPRQKANPTRVEIEIRKEASAGSSLSVSRRYGKEKKMNHKKQTTLKAL